jgi:hypothetical protein
VAIKKLNTSIPPVSLNSNTGHYWGTSTGNGGYVYPSVTSGTTLTTGNATINWNDGTFMNSDIIEYIDIFYQFMGIDMDYKRFSEMTKEEKKGFIRDLKLKKLIEEK